MRPIKYKAWDRILKIWTNYKIEDDMIYIMVKTSGTWIRHDVRNDDRFYLMQFTGLLDKNGKEIYEGDVVKLSEKLLKITFHRGSFWAEQYLLSQINTGCTIEGNIYDSPDLIK